MLLRGRIKLFFRADFIEKCFLAEIFNKFSEKFFESLLRDELFWIEGEELL